MLSQVPDPAHRLCAPDVHGAAARSKLMLAGVKWLQVFMCTSWACVKSH